MRVLGKGSFEHSQNGMVMSVSSGEKHVIKLGTLKVGDVGRDLVDREIVHSFVKSSKFGNLNFIGFNVTQDDVFESVWNASKE